MKWHQITFAMGVGLYLIGTIYNLFIGLATFDKLSTLVLYLMALGIYYKISDE